MIQIYILSLRGGYFYVGTTLSCNVSYSIKRHLSGDGIEWTKIHKPLALVKQIPCTIGINPRLQEDLHVKQLMIDYGIEKVRGGSYSDVVLSLNQRFLLEKEFQYAKTYSAETTLCWHCSRPAEVCKCRIKHNKFSPVASYNSNNFDLTTSTTTSSCASIDNLIEHFYLASIALINANYFDERTHECIKATLSIIEIIKMKMEGRTAPALHHAHHSASLSSSSPRSNPLSSKTEHEKRSLSSIAVNICSDTVPMVVSSDSSHLHESMSTKLIENPVCDGAFCSVFASLSTEPCTRCGRHSHHRSQCNETVDIHGFDLSDCF